MSVVIPTRDRPGSLRDAVRSILAGTALPAEIVVGDQSLAPCDLGTHPDVRIVHLHLSSRGVSAARNAAVATASSEIVLLLDDDMIVAADWLERMVDALERRPGRIVVSGGVAAAASHGSAPSTTTASAPEVYEGRPYRDAVFTGNLGLRRQAFRDVGAFDERLGPGTRFPAAEDSDFGFRLLEAGYQVHIDPEPVAHHVGGRSGRDRLALEWRYGRGQGAYYAKHLRASDGYMRRRLWLNARERLRFVPRLVLGDRRAVREVAYLTGMLSGLAGWLLRHGPR